MAKWLGVVALAATVALGGPVARPAAAADMNMSGPSCSPDGTSLMLTAQNHQFDKSCLAVPAGQPFTLHFDNKDADRHSVAILASHTSTQVFFQGDIVRGPRTITYSVPALPPGTWHFHCAIHPNLMNGTFIVAAAGGAPAATAPVSAPPPTPAPAAGASPTRPSASMGGGGGMPVLTPTPSSASGPSTPPAAAPAPAPAVPTPSRSAAAAPAPSAPAPAAGNSPLARTGPASDRLLLVLAGAALGLGGLLTVGAARRPRSAQNRINS